MAEYLLRHRLGRGSGWTVCSAGVAGCHGVPASRPAIQALKEKGIDLTPHQSQPVNRELVDEASLIVVMTASHLMQLRAVFPSAIEKSFLLKSFAAEGRGGDVEDPIGAAVEVYREVRDEIEAALPELMAFMKNFELE